MNLENLKTRALRSWATVGLLALLCLVLAGLQYVWIGELSRGERTRLQDGLQSALQRLSRDGNEELATAVSALRPPAPLIEESGRETAYAQQYLRWRDAAANAALFRKIALAVPNGEEIAFLQFDEAKETFLPAEWPKDWNPLHDSLLQRLTERRGGPNFSARPTVLEIPRFASRGDGPGREQEWLILDVDPEYLQATWLPQLISRHIGTGIPLSFRVVDRFDPSKVLFQSSNEPGFTPEASISFLEYNRFEPGRGGGPPRPPGDRSEKGDRAKRGGGNNPFFRKGGPPPDFNRGRLQLDVRYAEGSLDSIVNRIRLRNLGISAAILGLMLLTAVMLVRFSRQQQHLAELQMNFVAGVSHELRTPLTVIRTAAYNLRGRVAANPAQVERYGTLIQDESEKLTALVEQVLRFSSARAGHAVGEKAPVAVESVIEEALHSRRLGTPGAKITIERDLQTALPLVMADEMALKHAIQNLLDNAVKYGTENSDWIGVAAHKIADANGDMVEVRISDRGPGIPKEEQSEIFNPFFRGRRAQQDQIHGTGLGLNLVKKIIEAHGGTIRVESEPGHGTSFILRIPAAPAELQDEFANTSG